MRQSLPLAWAWAWAAVLLSQWTATASSFRVRRPVSARLPASRSSTALLLASVAPPKLELGADGRKWLTSIIDYGEARMARRAVKTLEQIPPRAVAEEHYTEAIWACEKSDQFELALEVLDMMREADMPRTTRTYEALASCAEKTDHWEEALAFLEDARSEGLPPSKALFNSCMWAADKGGHPELAVQLLNRMEQEGVERDADTYAAATWACEKQGDAETAQHVFDLMRAEKVPISTVHYRGAMWALLKGGRWEAALTLFDEMGAKGVLHDDDSFTAAIWSCAVGVSRRDPGDLGPMCPNSLRAVTLLRLMKLEGFKRTTSAFDGCLSALSKAGDWETILEVLRWMDRDSPVVKKSAVTYQVAIDCLDAADPGPAVDKDALVMELYQAALRDGHFVPWVAGSRTVDLRGMSFALAKVTIKSILASMREGRLARFQLDVALATAFNGEEGEGWQFDEPSFDIMALVDHLLEQPPVNALVGDVIVDNGALHVYFTKETIDEWCLSSPFDPMRPSAGSQQ